MYVGMGARLRDKSRLSGPAGKPCLFLGVIGNRKFELFALYFVVVVRMYVELELMYCVYYEAGEPSW